MGAIQAPIRPLNLSTDSVTTHPDGTTQPVSAATLPLPTGAAADATVLITANRFAPSIGSPTVVTASGDTTVYTPAAGKRVRLKWIGLSSPSTNSASVVIGTVS